MTLANFFKSEFEDLPVDKDGFLEDSPELEEWKRCLGLNATSFEEECPESCDSTLVVTFTDGSKARYANPKQMVYPTYFSTAQYE